MQLYTKLDTNFKVLTYMFDFLPLICYDYTNGLPHVYTNSVSHKSPGFPTLLTVSQKANTIDQSTAKRGFMRSTTMAQTWLSVERIARELDVSEETVRNWIRRGQLKAYKFGRDYRIKQTDFDAFVESQASEPKTGE